MNAETGIDLEEVDLAELSGSLGFLLRIAQLQAFDLFFAHCGEDLKPGEFSTLYVISCNPGIRQGVLARVLRIKPALMTKMIRRLEDRGALARTIPEDDRRSVRLSLTPQGEAFMEDRRATFLGHEAYSRHTLDPAEATELARLLRKYAGLSTQGHQP